MKVDLVLGVLPWALFSQLALAGRLVGRQGVTPTCASGNTYLVVPGDDCQKISLAKSVSTRALIATNNLNAECSNLIGAYPVPMWRMRLVIALKEAYIVVICSSGRAGLSAAVVQLPSGSGG